MTNSPRIVTTNNRKGSILDGQHSTYVTRYSSYSNIYETEEINSGLSLEVTPSLGESGYISLEITAKYTNLTGNISGSPVESGQILNNHVFVRDNEPFLLGAFKKLEDQEIVRRVPLLGYILPYLFSKKVKVQSEKNILVVLTPRVIDLQGSPVPDQRPSEIKE
ncbi:MAG: type II and III secretion system protein [FCB group bacterium]|nr:type II and III secretion system protein [FCB group bacterium]